MYSDDNYAYWLDVKGTKEEQQEVFDLLSEEGVIGEYLEPDGSEDAPYAHYCYPQDVGSGPEWNEEEMGRVLHGIAVKLPDVILEIEGENVDDGSYGFTKRFHGDMYQESHLSVRMQPLIDGADVPYAQRLDNPNPINMTKRRAMNLYSYMRDVFNEDNNAYYIAKNLAYLAQSVGDVPLDTLYQLAERVNTCTSSQCFLTEERLDAVRKLLERGMVQEADGEQNLMVKADEMPEFLLTCSDDTFVYLLDQTAIYNQELYAYENSMDAEELAASNLVREINAFQSEAKKPSLADQIAGASNRVQSGSENKEFTPER